MTRLLAVVSMVATCGCNNPAPKPVARVPVPFVFAACIYYTYQEGGAVFERCREEVKELSLPKWWVERKRDDLVPSDSTYR